MIKVMNACLSIKEISECVSGFIVKRRVKKLLAELHLRKLAPKKIDISRIGDYFFIVAYNEIDHGFISHTAAGSQSRNIHLGMLKCIVEYIERQVLLKNMDAFCGFSEGLSSTGFAAYPSIFACRSKAIKIAREKARLEAIERFVFVQ